MLASKVTVLPETLEASKLTQSRRKQLRRESVKALIQSKPLGKRILQSQFMEVTGIKHSGQMSTFLKAMERDGEIQSDRITRRRVTYLVPGEVTVTKPAERASMAPPSKGIVRSFAHLPDALSELESSGIKFTLTISNNNE